MDDLVERDDAHKLVPIPRCRELLGDEAIGLTDDDLDRIRRHADVMARSLVEVFLQQQASRRD
jgi:hypothetical protein